MPICVKNSHILNVFLIFFVIICEILSSEVSRPRGVSLSRAALYNPEENFACFDGSKVIPFSHVNDDYCDCPDASDEPGTSACPHGTFHCTNAGHKPQNIASNRVNDGICDCCDGSDEYAKKGTQCANTCIELGRSAREEAQRLAQLIKAGKQVRVDLIQRGAQLKQEKKEKLAGLHRNRDEAVKVRSEKEKLKKQAEDLENAALEHYRKLEEEEKQRAAEVEAAKIKAEAIEIFNQYDSNSDGKVDISELQTRAIFDTDRNGEVSEQEARQLLNNEDSLDAEEFANIFNSNIKPYLIMEKGVFKPPRENVEHAEEEEGTHSEEGETEHEDDEGSYTDDEDADQPQEEPEQAATTYDEETQKLVNQATEARQLYTDADNAVRDIETEIKDIEEYLEKDFGPEEEFATLQGQCFEYTDHEYVYKLCPFDKSIQQPKSSSVETRLGVWGRWAGPDDDIYQVMMYDRGQSCWNGPQRSTRVRIQCGSENKILAVSEPTRCEYQFEFSTPAACREVPGDDRGQDDLHDEL